MPAYVSKRRKRRRLGAFFLYNVEHVPCGPFALSYEYVICEEITTPQGTCIASHHPSPPSIYVLNPSNESVIPHFCGLYGDNMVYNTADNQVHNPVYKANSEPTTYATDAAAVPTTTTSNTDLKNAVPAMRVFTSPRMMSATNVLTEEIKNRCPL